MEVKCVWEFDADVSDLNPEFINIIGIAKDITFYELCNMFKCNTITQDDFDYIVEEE